MPMFLFMYWMTGSNISIYSIMFTVQMASNPITQLFNVKNSFKQFEHDRVNLLMPKLLFIACNCVTIALALYKFANMGIIPVLPMDWAGLFSPRLAIEQNQVIVI